MSDGTLRTPRRYRNDRVNETQYLSDVEYQIQKLTTRFDQQGGVRFLVSAAGVAERDGQNERAIEILQRVIDIETKKYDKVRVLLQIAGIYKNKLNDFENTVSTLKTAYKLQQRASIAFNMAQEYIKAEQYQDADKYLKAAFHTAKKPALQIRILQDLAQVSHNLRQEQSDDSQQFLVMERASLNKASEILSGSVHHLTDNQFRSLQNTQEKLERELNL